MKKVLLTVCTLLLAAGLAGASCTRQDQGTVAGAAIGGIAGSALTGGSALGTVAGAVGGGLIGRNVAQ